MVRKMKNWKQLVGMLSMMFTFITLYDGCRFIFHQPKMPDSVKALKTAKRG